MAKLKLREIWMQVLLSAVLLIILTSGVLFTSSLLSNRESYLKAFVAPTTHISFSTGNCNCSMDLQQLGTSWKPQFNCQCPAPAQEKNISCPPPTKEIVQVEKPCNTKVNVIKYEPWWAKGKTWHYPIKFPRCSLDACFNFSRCYGKEQLKIKDPEEACIFMVFLDNQPDPWRKPPYELPLWNNGLNHALVIFADKWSQRGVHEDRIGMASILQSEAHETLFRPGFDISIPLEPRYHFHEFKHLKPRERKYFITFKGTRYLGRKTGEGMLRSDDTFRHLHNGDDIIVVTSCKHFINDLIRKENSSEGIHFALVPAGIQPTSYRFGEVLSAGAIPILIADNYVKPFNNLFPWYPCLIQFPTSEMHRIVTTVRAMNPSELEKRQRACLRIYHTHFQNDTALLQSSLAALEERFLGAVPAFSAHLSSLYSDEHLDGDDMRSLLQLQAACLRHHKKIYATGLTRRSVRDKGRRSSG